MSTPRLFLLGALVGATVVASTNGACAGGFSHGSGTAVFAGANSQGSTEAKSAYLDFATTTYAQTGVQTYYGGKIADGLAKAGNDTQYKAFGESTYHQKNAAKAKVYAKGGNIMAKARSTTHTKIYIAGHAYVVTNEVARAMTRFTPIGTTAAADSITSAHAAGSGYIGVTRGTSDQAYVRVVR